MFLCLVVAGVSLSGPVDLGASIITGLIGNPVHTLCRQLLRQVGLPYRPAAFSSLLHFLTSHGAVYDSRGERVEAAVDKRVESGIYNRALAGTDHYRHNCKDDSNQQPTQHKHGIATETTNHSHTASSSTSAHSPASTSTTASGEVQQQGAAYEADKDKLRLSGGWEEAQRMSLREGMERALSELDVQMTHQERVGRQHSTTQHNTTRHTRSVSLPVVRPTN